MTAPFPKAEREALRECARRATAEVERVAEDGFECAACLCTIELDDGSEPTPLCHGCAQLTALQLADGCTSALDALDAAEAKLEAGWASWSGADARAVDASERAAMAEYENVGLRAEIARLRTVADAARDYWGVNDDGHRCGSEDVCPACHLRATLAALEPKR